MTALLGLPLVQELSPNRRSSGVSEIARGCPRSRGWMRLGHARAVIRLWPRWRASRRAAASASTRRAPTTTWCSGAPTPARGAYRGSADIGEFLDLRLAPPWRPAPRRRAHRDLARRLARTSNLLSTQVDVALGARSDCSPTWTGAPACRRGCSALWSDLDLRSHVLLSVLLGNGPAGLNVGPLDRRRTGEWDGDPFMFLLTWMGLRWAAPPSIKPINATRARPTP